MTHTVQRGETLSGIAREYGTTVAQIVKLNGIANPNIIRVGQQLLVESTGIIYTPQRKLIGLSMVNLHVFRIANSVRRRVEMPSLPGTARVSRLAAGAELAINASFFWAGYPLGPTVAGNQVHGYPMPGYYPIDIEQRLILPQDITSQELVSRGTTSVVSGYPRLVSKGVAGVTTVETYLTPRHPRTAIGWSYNETIAVVADGRSSSSAGLTLQQLATLMRDLGCHEAYNLDGGGSSVAVYRGKIVNRPSDGNERSVVTALLFG